MNFLSNSSLDVNEDPEECWYVAIGSMMNPISLAQRELSPLESYPVEIINYSIQFFGKGGMAEAVYENGKSFHGVLHKMTKKDMIKLDSMEVGYSRSPCQVRLYDNSLRDATVYTLANSSHREGINNPPSERYMELLITGSKHFGVSISHIEYLQSLPMVPRKKPSEYRSLSCPVDLPVWSADMVEAGDGLEGRPLYFSINGKVCVLHATSKKDFIMYDIFLMFAGKPVEIGWSKGLYEPKYGTHDKLEDFTREHCAFLEDMLMDHESKVSVVALINQKYAD